MADAAYDRLRAAFRAFVDELFPRLQYMGGYQYTVTSCDFTGQTVDAEPVNSSLGLPTLVQVPVRSPLLMVKVAPGEVVIVSFENYDPAFPYISGLPAAGAGSPVTRQGDVVWVTVDLVPALVGAGPAATPDLTGTFWVIRTLPGGSPPLLLPTVGGSLKLYGIAATGSQSVRSR